MSALQVVRSLVAFAAVLAVAVPGLQVASAKDPVILSPSSNWNLDYADDRCRLMRVFETEHNKTVLVLEQLSPSLHFDLVIAGQPLRRVSRDRIATLRMGPGFDAHERKFQLGNLGEYEPALVFGTVSVNGFRDSDEDASDGEVKAERIYPSPYSIPSDYGEKIEWLEVSQRGHAVRLNTGPMLKPFEALNACTADLLKVWGLEPETLASITTAAELINIDEMGRLIGSTLKQKGARESQIGTVELRLILDESGKITDCQQIELTRADNISDKPCEVFRDAAEFSPARDAAGNGVKSYTTQRIRYVIR